MKNNYNQNLEMMKKKFTILDKIVKPLIAVAFFGAFSFVAVLGMGQTDTYSTAGTYSWTCPEGVTSITVECWGAGGAGGGQNQNSDGGGGGGGGAYARLNSYTVTSGNQYLIVVGAGGTGIAASTGNPGGSSYFINNATVLAVGGNGGSPSTGTPPAGGLGGNSGSCVGDVTYSGGQGEIGRNSNTGIGGYGGSSAGTAANGYSGPQTWTTQTYPTASTPTGAGHGGNGGASGSYGSAPVSGNGGGGGGSGEGSNRVGGNGAPGKIVITYTCPSYTYNTADAGLDQSLISCATSTTLAGNEPDYGIGTWTVESGTATITDPNDPETTITGLVLGTTVTMRWTFTNGSCYNNYDEMTITTSTGPGCWNYCASGWTNLTDDYISNVSFGSIDNTSVANTGGYGDYTSQSTNILRGSTYQLCVDIYVNGAFTQHCFAYFDWNNNGDLSDAGESYDLGDVTGTGQLCANITIPAGATLGNTRMRIIEKYNADPTGPCESGTWGETEDYTVTILGPPVVTVDPTNQSICYNSSADFNVSVTGITPYTYQWKYQGSNVADGTPTSAVYSGANTATLSVSGAIANGTYSAYTCQITNAYGNVTSAGADLIISATSAPNAPTALTKSDDMICSSESVTLGATVSSGVLEWYTGSCSGASETSPVAPTETTIYYAKAYDSGTGCRSACSEITVYVLDEIEIIEQPESQYGCAGESITFSVIATGAGLTYQWQEDSGSGFADITDGGVYSGATTMDLVISDVTGLDGYDYQCVVTGTCDAQTSTSATLSEISSGLSGTYTVGTAGDYATLKAAFDDINSFGLSGNTFLEVISNITETAEASLNEWVDCAGVSGYTVTIYPTGATRTISGNIATSLVTLNGADKISIDGRIDMSGAANSLIFSNSSLTGATLTLINDACANTVAYTTLEGATTSGSNGVIFFSTGTTTGNDDNLILECDIKDSGTTPLYGVYAVGSADKNNNDNTISKCNIYDFWESASITRGIHLGTGNTRWTISENSIYQTTTRADAAFYGISIMNSNGGEFKIIGNYIGGTDTQCGGSKLTYSSASYGIGFEGIIIFTNSVGVSLIKDNVIKNISWQSAPVTSGTQLPIFTGIDIYEGRIDVIENIVGDESTNSIDVTVDDYLDKTAWNNGIYHAGEGNVIGNEIGSITFDGTIGDQCGFNAIEISGTIITDQIISDNIIGHPTTANSISFASGTTPAMTMGGIYFGTAGDFHTTVSNNKIANINLGTSGTSCFFIGLNNQASDGDQTIVGNDIHDITSSSARTGSFSTATDFPAIVGIRTNNTVAGVNLSISNNSIYNLTSTNATASIKVFGIFANNATSGNQIINANNIHSFATANPSNLVWQEGIWINSGAVTLSNNMIRLGISGINNDNFIAGIEMQSTSTNSVLFNSIYIGGSATGSQNTFAYYRSGTGTTDIRNNIFVNARTGGTGIPYAYFLSVTTNLTSNYNIYSDNAGGVNAYAGALRTSLAQIQTGTGQDINSMVANPLYVNPTGIGIACDLHIPLGSPAIGAAVPGTGITTDIDNQERVAAGPCIGADENVTAPYGTDVYGIYSPDGIDGNIIDCEIVSEGGAPGGTGYNVADPNQAYWPNVNISGYQVITASNISCTGSEFTYTTADGSPDWLFGNGSSPTSSTSSPSNSEYESTGYKDLIESVKVYNDFINITLEAPEAGSILGAPSGAGCPTTYTYTSSEAGSAGFLYDWDATAPSGCTVTIDDPTSPSTDITFVNQTGVDQIFLVTLEIETECCGKLETVERYITIFPGPTMPEITGNPYSTCTGGEEPVSVNSPDPAYSYEWFDAITGGTQLGSGTSHTFTTMPSGTNYYYVQSTNSFGCSSQRTEIEIEGVDPAAPSVDNESTCGDNDVTLSINSPTGGYIYLWYTGSCEGTLLQASTAANFTYNVTGNTTFYVAAIPPGCDTSVCATPTITYNTPTDPILWEGDDATDPNNWFVAENWENGCIPTCATNVSIPNLANDPDIGYDATQVAEAHDLNLQSGAELTFSDNKAILQICGDFTHSGTLTTNDFGSIQFTGSTAQSYIYSSGTGEFNNVKIDNSAASPTVTITGGDMIVSTKGIFTFVNGTVITGANYLVLKNSASTAIGGYNADRYVNGNLRRYITTTVTDYVFPVGVASRYALADITNNSLTGINYLDAKFLTSFTNTGSLDPAKAFDGAMRYDYIASEGIWQIDADVAPTGGTYDIALWFNDGGGGTFANLLDSQFAPLKRSSASTLASDWTAIGGTATLQAVSTGYAERKGWSSFSQYAVGYKEIPLPVELLKFSASLENKSVSLDWITATEINNDYFIVEKSQDAISFKNIGMVYSLADGGNSNTILNYNFIDNDVTSGVYYYRLKQFDIDGTYTYSEIVSVILNSTGTFSICPNPAKETVEITYFCSGFDQPIVKLYDERGRLVLSQKIECYEGTNKTIIDISRIAPSVYTLTLISKDSVEKTKLIKQ